MSACSRACAVLELEQQSGQEEERRSPVASCSLRRSRSLSHSMLSRSSSSCERQVHSRSSTLVERAGRATCTFSNLPLARSVPRPRSPVDDLLPRAELGVSRRAVREAVRRICATRRSVRRRGRDRNATAAGKGAVVLGLREGDKISEELSVTMGRHEGLPRARGRRKGDAPPPRGDWRRARHGGSGRGRR